MDSLAEYYEQLAERLSGDADGASDPDRWHLENAAYFYRAKARTLRTVTNARALTDGIFSLGGGK